MLYEAIRIPKACSKICRKDAINSNICSGLQSMSARCIIRTISYNRPLFVTWRSGSFSWAAAAPSVRRRCSVGGLWARLTPIFFFFFFVRPLNYYYAVSASLITRKSKDDAGWFLVHKSASREARTDHQNVYQ